MNDRLLKALKCENRGRPPVWLMRQAGRYMPEYRALRAKYPFLELCHRPELIAEVTMLPINAFGMDAAILFSDILVIAEALGMKFQFEEGIGPIIEPVLSTAKDVDALLPNSEALHYVQKGIQLLTPQLRVPLIGFCGAPFTVASYLIEGRASRDLKKTKLWMLRDPESFHALLQKIAAVSIEYLKMQIQSGVHAVQIFESWAQVLGAAQFREFSLNYLAQILQALKPLKIPVILFCRGASGMALQVASTEPAAIGLDWSVDLSTIRAQTAIALQGNLDPDVLHANSSTIKREVRQILKSMHADPGYIFNLGHGIQPDTPVDAVKTLIECIHES